MSTLVVVEELATTVVVPELASTVSVEEVGTTVVVQEVGPADIVEIVAVGPQGASGTLVVGSVTTGAAGSSVSITNVGTSTDAVLNIRIPRGDTGDLTPELVQAKEDAEAAAVASEASRVASAGSASSANTSAVLAAGSASNAATSASAAANSASSIFGAEDVAVAKAAEAVISATNAATSASTASTKASEASTSATNAATSATAAASSATAAASFATAASGSATTATTKASEATTQANNSLSSANDAAQSALDADASATSATNSASTATTKAAEASTSATNAAASSLAATNKVTEALTSATNAASSATAASGSALSASASASTATSKASEASTSATNAAASAATATTKASEASTSATNAATSATGAGTSATSAAGSASAASASATSASTSAGTATTQAGIATTKASEAATSASNAATSASTATTKASEATTAASSASTFATTATTKASEALTSAGNASTSASQAATSAINAATSATAADASEAAAATSETNAAASASTASTNASTATTKASEASSSATSASGSAATATTKASEASTSATAAAGSATSAGNSATTATTQATNAAGSATAAQTAAATATTKAAEAVTSASNAASSATTASTQATAASGSATAAAGSASTASTQAGIATTKASEASTSATNAAGSATTATTKASEAASSATAAAAAKNAAETARDQTLSAFDSFDDRYLGQKASDPTVDNDGNALVAGAIYFNTGAIGSGGGMKVYDGSAWLVAYASLAGTLLKASNLSDLNDAATARTNLGLGNVENKSSATIRGEITSSNVTTALGFTPYNAASLSGALAPYLTSASASSTYQPILVSGTSIKTVNGNSVLGSGNIQIDGGVTSFNTRTGAITLSSSDVTTALGFTPYSAANPSGYITNSALSGYLTSATAASTYQPIGAYLTGITSSQVTTALGYTPANKAGDTFTGSVATSNAGGFTANSAAKLWTDSGRGRIDLWESSTQSKSLRVMNANGYGIIGMISAENLELWTNGTARVTIGGSNGNATFTGRINSVGYSTSWGGTDGTTTGALNAVMGTNTSASWLVSGTSSGVFRGGIQVLDAGGQLRIYEGTNYLALVGGAGTINGNAILTSANYSSYSPTLTGTGASGSWGISISGSAAQLGGVTASDYFKSAGSYPNTDMNTPVEGYWHVASGSTGLPENYYGHRWDYDHLNNGQWVAQMYSPTSGDAGLWFRQRRDFTWQTWRKLLDSSNYNSYSPTLTGGGASGTWSISVTGTAGSISGFNNPTAAATANTIVYRDGNGHITGNYILGSYFNSSAGNSENPTIGQVWTQSTGDNYLRKSTPAHFISQLSLLTTSNYSSYALPLSGGTVSGSTTFNSAVIVNGRDTRYFEGDSFKEFYVGGDANTYYPVLLGPSVWFHFARWSISRGYADTAPWDPIGTGAHKGGLTLTWEWSGDGAWGGNDKTIRVIQFSEQYTTMVGGMALSVNGFIVWLRGGNAYYRFHGPGGAMNSVTPYYSTFTAANGSTYAPRSYDSNTVGSEVTNRMPVRGVAELYDGGNRVLHAGNYSSYALPLTGGTVSGAVRASQITAGGSTNTDANLGVQGTTHLTGMIYYGGSVGNVNSWSSISTSSAGTHTFSGSRFIFDRYGYGSQALLDLQNGAITLSQPTTINGGGGYPLQINSTQRYIARFRNTSASGAGWWLANDSNTLVFHADSSGDKASLNTDGTFSALNYVGSKFIAAYGSISDNVDGSPWYGLGNAGNLLGTGGNVVQLAGYFGLRLRSSNTVLDIGQDRATLNTTLNATGASIRQGNNLARPNASWGSSGATGMAIFKLPGSSGNYGMVHMVFDIYEYNSNSVSTVIVGGHNWNGSWYNTGANVIGQLGKQVRLGYKDGQYCVVFGDSGSYWEYGQIVLRKIQNGAYYDNIMDLGAAISVVFTSTESFSNIGGDLRALRTPASFNAGGAITQAGNQVLHAGNYSSYALPIGGGNVSGAINLTNRNNGLLVNASGTSSAGGSIAIQQVTGEGWTGIFCDFEPYTGWGLWHDNPNNYFCFTAESSSGSLRSFTVPSRYSGDRTAHEKFRIDQNTGNAYTGGTHYAYGYRGHSNVAGTGEAVYAPAGLYSTGTNWLYGTIITNGNAINASGATCTLTATRANRANGNFYIDDNYGCGIVGAYASTRYQGVFAMGDSYKLPADGTSTGSLYGMAWSHPNAGGVAGNLDSHGMIVVINGGYASSMSYSIKASGNVTAYSDERLKTNWREMPENFVARLAQVKVGIYDRTDGEKITQVGVGAQSFQKLLPEAITKANDEMETLSVNYGGAALASAVELAKDNVELRAQMKAQELRIAKLESLINQLIGD